MELFIALAAEDVSARISDGVRSILKKSYSSLFANVFVRVFDIDDRHKSDIKIVREMPKEYAPVWVTVENAQHDIVTFVFAVPTLAPVLHIPNPPLAYVIHNEKVEQFKLEPRVVQVRGADYAIAAAVARRAPNFIEIGVSR